MQITQSFIAAGVACEQTRHPAEAVTIPLAGAFGDRVVYRAAYQCAIGCAAVDVQRAERKDADEIREMAMRKRQRYSGRNRQHPAFDVISRQLPKNASPPRCILRLPLRIGHLPKGTKQPPLERDVEGG